VSWTEFRQYLKEWGEQRDQVNIFFHDLELKRNADNILDDKVDSVVGAVKNIDDYLGSVAISPKPKAQLVLHDTSQTPLQNSPSQNATYSPTQSLFDFRTAPSQLLTPNA